MIKPTQYLAPRPIEAVQLPDNSEDPGPDVIAWLNQHLQAFNTDGDDVPLIGWSVSSVNGRLILATVHGLLYPRPGDWIVRDSTNSFHVYEDDIFRALYSPTPEPNKLYDQPGGICSVCKTGALVHLPDDRARYNTISGRTRGRTKPPPTTQDLICLNCTAIRRTP